MNLVYSWLKDFVDIDLSLEELARLLTMIGLEVEEVRLVGLSATPGVKHEFKFTGLSWDPDKIVVGQVNEVMPHPNAERLVLCRLNDGIQEQVVLTGAPNLYPYKGLGPLEKPIKVAYAREGAQIYDGHQPGQVLTKLKRARIRGVESYSMACSEKELGISDEHEGIIFLDDDAVAGTPLCDYMGDAVFTVSILPNMIRNACMLGAAREIAAATGKPLRKPVRPILPQGEPIEGKAYIEITDPSLNPRFLVGLIRGVTARPSPYWVQRRLRLAGMRPINGLVDATNYVMLESGEPLHAFDYDVLVRRAGGKAPTIITRAAYPGEKLVTLDNVERKLEEHTIMVTDTAGSLSLAGMMGGLESEITENTHNILLEGATWNFINIRKASASLKLQSEAAYRFSRGVHPALALEGVLNCMQRMVEWGGGEIAPGLVDNYAQPYHDPTVCIREADIIRHLGIEIPLEEAARLLQRLEFECRIEGDQLLAKAPPIRLDIGEGIVGLADVIEEIARHYGYERIPSRRMQDTLPEQKGNPALEQEMRIQDVLVNLGLQEVITYRMTTPEKEKKVFSSGSFPSGWEYVGIANPIASDRTVMRRSLLASVLETLEHNIRLRERLTIFEMGPEFVPQPDQTLPDEQWKVVIGLTGLQGLSAWDKKDNRSLDFYDLKGMLQYLLQSLHVEGVKFERGDHPSLHPGKCALLKAGEITLGHLGELHPLVKERYDFLKAPILIAELDLKSLRAAMPVRFNTRPVPVFPPVLEDLAVIVDEEVTAEQVENAICTGGGKLLVDVRLFDIFRGPQIGEGKKSLAYSLTYQSSERTLDEKDAEKIRKHIITCLDKQLGARIRS